MKNWLWKTANGVFRRFGLLICADIEIDDGAGLVSGPKNFRIVRYFLPKKLLK